MDAVDLEVVVSVVANDVRCRTGHGTRRCFLKMIGERMGRGAAGAAGTVGARWLRPLAGLA